MNYFNKSLVLKSETASSKILFKIHNYEIKPIIYLVNNYIKKKVLSTLTTKLVEHETFSMPISPINSLNLLGERVHCVECLKKDLQIEMALACLTGIIVHVSPL